MRSSPVPAYADFPPSALAARLVSARDAVEKRFLQAGNVLGQAAESIGQLIRSLDRMVEVLGSPAALEATGRLREAAASLLTLPERNGQRLALVDELRREGGGLAASVDDMKRSLAYLRAFASSIKITAAGISSASREFGDFGQEICQRVAQGDQRLGAFEVELAVLLRLFDAAHAQETGFAAQCGLALPAVPDSLCANAAELSRHHARIIQVSADVAGLGRSVQSKIGVALSGLQIGDITRQRIEHVTEILAMAEAVDGLGPDQRRRLTAFVNAMLAQQLEGASADFHQQIDRLRQAMDGLAGDASTIQGLRDLAMGREAGKENLLHRLEADIAGAQRLVVAMADSKRQSVALGDSAAAAAAKLGLGIVELQDIKTDVQHMAINTSLKCARIGDEGKPLAVIAIELRHHSGQIETLALSALSGLDAVAEEAGRLLNDGKATVEEGCVPDTAAGIGVWLEEVRSGLQRSSAMVETDLATLAAQGAAVATTLRQAAASLDLRAEIGAVLDAAAAALNREADPNPSHVSDLEGPLGALLGKAGALYTMASEREAHATTVKGLAFALPDSRPTVAAKPAASVDDMFF